MAFEDCLTAEAWHRLLSAIENNDVYTVPGSLARFNPAEFVKDTSPLAAINVSAGDMARAARKGYNLLKAGFDASTCAKRYGLSIETTDNPMVSR